MIDHEADLYLVWFVSIRQLIGDGRACQKNGYPSWRVFITTARFPLTTT